MAQVDPASLYRLTGERGLALWSYVTQDKLKDILAPGYFDSVAGLVNRHDRIFATTESEAHRARHATLVVKDSHRDRGVILEYL
jgi:hypothetical protein